MLRCPCAYKNKVIIDRNKSRVKFSVTDHKLPVRKKKERERIFWDMSPNLKTERKANEDVIYSKARSLRDLVHTSHQIQDH